MDAPPAKRLTEVAAHSGGAHARRLAEAAILGFENALSTRFANRPQTAPLKATAGDKKDE